jgi:hypothetical protein
MNVFIPETVYFPETVKYILANKQKAKDAAQDISWEVCATPANPIIIKKTK